MKKIIAFLFLLNFTLSVSAETFEAGVAVNYIPRAFFGSWRILAKLEDTNSPRIFKPQSIDFWNLSRDGDTIALENPLSGANAEILVHSVEGNLIVFSKKLFYDRNKALTDTVTIRLDGNKFSGINSLKLETYSLIDNHLIKTETAHYNIKGEKISGESILEEPTLVPDLKDENSIK